MDVLDSLNLTLEEKEETINKLVQELYKAGRGFVPRFPWVFVRTMDKEQQIGHIVLPEGDQNKPIHEGIVLAVWQGFVKQQYINGNYIQTPMQSELKPGDHVLFPHWAGLPVNGYRDQRYRIVKEAEWSPSQEGGIFAIVNYDNDKVFTALEDILLQAYVGTDVKTLEDLAESINERFLLVDRSKQSVTLSGR